MQESCATGASIFNLSRCFDETRLCWRLGAVAFDRVALATDSLLVQLRNFPARADAPVKQRRLRLPHRLDSPIDFHYRLGEDLVMLHKALFDQCYWIPPILTNVVRTVVDLGGIGSSILSFASQFPRANFICVEPDPRTAAILAQNVAWLGGRARVVQAGIDDQDALETLFDTIEVDQVDILKVDWEGAEKLLFGSRGPWWDKVRLIIVELHDLYGFKEFSQDMDDIGFRAVAAGLGYGNMLPVAIRP